MNNEIFKIRKSIEGKACLIFAILMIIVTIFQMKYTDSKGLISNVQVLVAMIGNFSRYIITYGIMIIVCSMIFASEFVNGTFRYIMLRPVSLKKLILVKFSTSWLYSGMILIIVSILSYILGTIVFGSGELYGNNNIVLDKAATRYLLLLISSWISTLVIISFTMLISTFTKNNISTIVITFSILFSILFFSRFVPDKLLNVTPINYISSKEYLFETAINYPQIFGGVIINFLYSAIFTLIGYIKIKKIQN